MVVVHEVECSAFLLDDVLLAVREVSGLFVPSEVVLEVVELEVVLPAVSPLVLEVEELEVVELDQVLVVFCEGGCCS